MTLHSKFRPEVMVWPIWKRFHSRRTTRNGFRRVGRYIKRRALIKGSSAHASWQKSLPSNGCTLLVRRNHSVLWQNGFWTAVQGGAMRMNKRSLSISFVICCILISVVFPSCAVTPKIGGPITQQLRDGLYEGSYTGGPNKAVVQVKIESNRL